MCCFFISHHIFTRMFSVREPEMTDWFVSCLRMKQPNKHCFAFLSHLSHHIFQPVRCARIAYLQFRKATLLRKQSGPTHFKYVRPIWSLQISALWANLPYQMPVSLWLNMCSPTCKPKKPWEKHLELSSRKTVSAKKWDITVKEVLWLCACGS